MRSNQSLPSIRSSKTHPLKVAELTTSVGGIVGITFCPGKCGPSVYGDPWQRDLGADLDAVKRWGAGIVLTLVEAVELEELNVTSIGSEVGRRGMKWLHMPITDVNVPSAKFEAQWRREVPNLLDAMHNGDKLLVCCRRPKTEPLIEVVPIQN